ncbi:NADH-quinone oxidoreductase subunit NuoE [candidate division BRC1 bacterium HGW-BRC1-1]|jgi:NADH-quinone oxidoreductase subunit E|nr:MAG: NADH-quinone oxidoreductase subunit NuoE [candidate division BRC1 bacterium HGW-BRC1-1]
MIPQTLKTELTEYVKHYPSERVGLITVMHKLQKHYGGWLPDEAIAEAAEIVGIPEPEVEGVATFYNWFFREPVGRRIIVVCDSISCHLCGCDRLVEHFKKRLGIGMGETTADGEYTLLPVVCLGNCDQAPSIMIDEETYNRVTPEKLDEILEQLSAESAKGES